MNEIKKEVYVVLYKSIGAVESQIDKIYTKKEKAIKYCEEMNKKCTNEINLEFYWQPESLWCK